MGKDLQKRLYLGVISRKKIEQAATILYSSTETMKN